MTLTARFIVDLAMYFGLFVTIAMALNFQYGNAGIPNMGCALQVIVGGFTVSAITTRLIFMLVMIGGVKLLPYTSDYDWVYNNQINVGVLTNEYLKTNAFLGIAMFLFSIAVALVLGMVIGYLISIPSIRLKSTYLMITLIAMADSSQIIGRNIIGICGGTLGVFIPNVFAWYSGDRGLILAVISLIIGLISFFIFRTMLNSPYGRLMRAIRENDVTVGSIGKNSTAIRRNILIFASGITAITGVIIAFYFSFVVEANYQRSVWTYWPWLMLIIGGPGNNAGTFLGCILVVAMRRLLIIYKWVFVKYLFFPASYFEQILLGVFLLVFMIFKSRGLIPERPLYIPGINYSKIIMEEERVDWRSSPKQINGGRRFKLWGRKKEGNDQ